MRNKFDEQLNVLNQELMKMGSTIEESIQKAVEALIKHDVELAKSVVEHDDEVDKEQKTIESICFNLLIQQQPVAKDLRNITAALKMVTDMERIGDHAADISEITIQLADQEYIKKLEHISDMARATMVMLIQAVESFVERDMEKAKSVIDQDDNVDDLFEKVRDELISMIQHDRANGEQATDLLLIAKYFERIGDHATNIAEWVIFSLDSTGKHSGIH
ncbi:MAG: phosphate signaling complex protein PhoU [Lachnospira sp.]